VYVINISWWERLAYVVLLHGNKAYYPWLSSFHAIGNNLLDGDVGGLSLSKLISLSHSLLPPPNISQESTLLKPEKKTKKKLF